MSPIARLLLIATLLTASGCAARTARPEHPANGRDAAADGVAIDARSQTAAPKRREMTWNEYYTEIAQRARKHGVMVIWVHPPEPAQAAATPPRSSADDAPR